MTAAIICRYILESKRNEKRKLLVCGPTNKSVVVLLRKVLSCVKDDESTSIVLVGDRKELLADNRQELEPVFVYTYISVLRRALKALRKKLLDSWDFGEFSSEKEKLIERMRIQLSSTCSRSLEWALDGVQQSTSISDHDDRKGAVEKSFEKVFDALVSFDQQEVEKDLLGSADVVFCTLSTAGSMMLRRMGSVDDLIVDEASAATEPDILIPLNTNPKRLLLVGDPHQLPATVLSPKAAKFGLGRSLQERLMFDNKFEYELLNTQYRMKPQISKWPLERFYGGKVTDGDNTTADSYRSNTHVLGGDAYHWVPTFSEEKKDLKSSTYNEGEGETIVAILLELKSRAKSGSNWFSPDRVRVITFYQAQVDRLRRLLSLYDLDEVMVSTVDASQGCESDIVVLSFVRGSSGHMGFVKDIRRLNVSLTRARYQLICVGNIHAIAALEAKAGNMTLRSMAEDAIERDSLVHSPPLSPPPEKRVRRKNQKKNGKHPKKRKKKPKADTQ